MACTQLPARTCTADSKAPPVAICTTRSCHAHRNTPRTDTHRTNIDTHRANRHTPRRHSARHSANTNTHRANTLHGTASHTHTLPLSLHATHAHPLHSFAEHTNTPSLTRTLQSPKQPLVAAALIRTQQALTDQRPAIPAHSCTGPSMASTQLPAPTCTAKSTAPPAIICISPSCHAHTQTANTLHGTASHTHTLYLSLHMADTHPQAYNSSMASTQPPAPTCTANTTVPSVLTCTAPSNTCFVVYRQLQHGNVHSQCIMHRIVTMARLIPHNETVRLLPWLPLIHEDTPIHTLHREIVAAHKGHIIRKRTHTMQNCCCYCTHITSHTLTRTCIHNSTSSCHSHTDARCLTAMHTLLHTLTLQPCATHSCTSTLTYTYILRRTQ